ncbi:hypothetical protein GJ744_011785 [Endocarpon pusillum]|uniref:Uncharacterized protein n=1 Tax=Endocarpon pusillum TaxID=364733 RepID=A0A8H7AG02_9EURO|nr:hypothetical protein GJ744_011785 [Endocarpon pusillum]
MPPTAIQRWEKNPPEIHTALNARCTPQQHQAWLATFGGRRPPALPVVSTAEERLRQKF